MKCCTGCLRTLPLNRFAVRRASHDGLTPCCKACKSESDRAWRVRNQERKQATARAWYLRNRTAILERARERARAAPGAKVEYLREYRRKNAERERERQRAARPRRNEAQRRRKARIKDAAIVPFSVAQLAARMAFWGNRCWMCGGPFEQVDHVKPLARGGSHLLANLRPACCSCNSSKKDAWPLPARLQGVAS